MNKARNTAKNWRLKEVDKAVKRFESVPDVDSWRQVII
jgi:hypothetical protein